MPAIDTNQQQMVYFEGAVSGSATSIIKYQMNEGEFLSTAIMFLENQFPMEADLENTYIEKHKDSKLIFRMR